MSDFSPDEYESLTGITKAEYEARVLAAAREAALEYYPEGSTRATIESVEIDGVALDTSLVILFRIPGRPECLFGRRERLWPVDVEAWNDESTPEQDGARCIELGIEEYVDQGGLVVRDCVRDGITWLP